MLNINAKYILPFLVEVGEIEKVGHGYIGDGDIGVWGVGDGERDVGDGMAEEADGVEELQELEEREEVKEPQ